MSFAGSELRVSSGGGNRKVLCFSIGLPGRFSQWCDEVVARLVGSSGNSVMVERWPSNAEMLTYERYPRILDRLACFAIGAEATHIVIGARQPDVGLSHALAETQARFLLALDQPRLAVADMLDETGADAALATRAVANSCALLMPYSLLPGALVLFGGAARANLGATVLTIAGHFGISIEADQAQAISNIVSADDGYPAGGRDWMSRVPLAGGKTVGGALSGYDEWFEGRGLGQLVWNRDLFIRSDQQRPANEVIDISGAAGTLIHGPYINLPPGTWNARVHLGLSPEAAQCPLVIDVHAEGQLAAVTLQPNVPGVHTADLTFSLGEAIGQGIEVRVNVASSEAKGHLAFGYVVLTPAGLQHPEAEIAWEEEFRASLDI